MDQNKTLSTVNDEPVTAMNGNVKRENILKSLLDHGTNIKHKLLSENVLDQQKLTTDRNTKFSPVKHEPFATINKNIKKEIIPDSFSVLDCDIIVKCELLDENSVNHQIYETDHNISSVKDEPGQMTIENVHESVMNCNKYVKRELTNNILLSQQTYENDHAINFSLVKNEPIETINENVKIENDSVLECNTNLKCELLDGNIEGTSVYVYSSNFDIKKVSGCSKMDFKAESHLPANFKQILGNSVAKMSPTIDTISPKIGDDINKGDSNKYNIAIDLLKVNNNLISHKSATLVKRNCKSKRGAHKKRKVGIKNIYPCSRCKFVTKYKINLVSHMRNHTGDKPYSCELCSNKFGRKDHLVKHMKIHTGEKPFNCNICDYKCLQKADLFAHIRTHTGEKPYTCDKCNYRCGRKDNLVAHMRTHTGEKPYACDQCNYRCGRKDTLITHMKIHTGLKIFSCHLCHFEFRHKVGLFRHMNTHIGERPFP